MAITEEELDLLRQDERLCKRIRYQVKSFWHPGEYVSFKRKPTEDEKTSEEVDSDSYGPIADHGPSSYLRCPVNQRSFWLAGGYDSPEDLEEGIWSEKIAKLEAGKPLNFYEGCTVRFLIDLLRRADAIRNRNWLGWLMENMGSWGGYFPVRQHGDVFHVALRRKMPERWALGKLPASKEGEEREIVSSSSASWQADHEGEPDPFWLTIGSGKNRASKYAEKILKERCIVILKNVPMRKEITDFLENAGLTPDCQVAAIMDALLSMVLAHSELWQEFHDRLMQQDKKAFLDAIDAALKAGKPFTAETLAEVAQSLGIEATIS